MPRNVARPPECSLLRIVDVIAGKWPIMVMGTLLDGPIRFNELRRTTGASQKMLAQTLRALERDGLVLRKVTPSVPVAVEYSATTLGRTLGEAMLPLRNWSDCYVSQVEAARHRWDENVRST
jgi:DNA-binding HxlR family transcriptional regulator